MKLKYQSYIANVTFSAVTSCFHGEVTNLKDPANKNTIIFLTSHKRLLQEAFQQAVEQYLLRDQYGSEIIV